jgi:hypothetical protein
MPRPIKPQANPRHGLWYVLEGRVGLIIQEWKSQNPSKFSNTLLHFVAINTFIAIVQAILGHWYCIGVV